DLGSDTPESKFPMSLLTIWKLFYLEHRECGRPEVTKVQYASCTTGSRFKRVADRSVREKLHPTLTTSTGSRDCQVGTVLGTHPLPRRGRPSYKPCSLVYRFSASARWRCFTALTSSRQTLLSGVSAGIK